MSGHPGASEQPVSTPESAVAERGPLLAMHVRYLAEVVARGSFNTGLRDYPVCMSDRARAAKAELDRLREVAGRPLTDGPKGQDGQLRDEVKL